MSKQFTVKAWESTYNLHFCLDKSLIRRYRNFYWDLRATREFARGQVPFGWKTNAATAWNLSLHTLYKLNLLIQLILRSTDPFEASASTLNMVLIHLLCCAFITEMGKIPFILHYSHPTIQGLHYYWGQINISSLNLNGWLVVQWIIWYGALVTAWACGGTSQEKREVVE